MHALVTRRVRASRASALSGMACATGLCMAQSMWCTASKAGQTNVHALDGGRCAPAKLAHWPPRPAP